MRKDVRDQGEAFVRTMRRWWQAKIDQLTDRALVAAWPIDRIDPVLRALFRAAGADDRAAKLPAAGAFSWQRADL